MVRVFLLVLAIGFAAIALFGLRRADSLYETSVYIGIPLLGLLLNLLAARRPKGWGQLALITQISMFGGAYLAEAYLHFYQKTAERTAPIGTDRRPKLEVLKDFRAQGIPATLTTVFRNQMVTFGGKNRFTWSDGTPALPFSGASNRFVVFCNESGVWETYQSDKHGFNNPKGRWVKNIPVATLGDSFTHGVCFDRPKHMVGKIETALGPVLNLGNWGTGPLYQLAVMREYLTDIQPQTVIWFLMEDNDLWGDLNDELKIPELVKYRTAGYRQNLQDRQTEIDRLVTDYVEGLIADNIIATQGRREMSGPRQKQSILSQVLFFAKLSFVRGLLGLGVDPGQAAHVNALYQTYGEILKEGKKTVESWGGKLAVVYLPAAPRFNSINHAISYNRQYDAVRREVAKAGLPLIDMLPVFEAHPQPLTLFTGHYTEEGYRLVAEQVIKALKASD